LVRGLRETSLSGDEKAFACWKLIHLSEQKMWGIEGRERRKESVHAEGEPVQVGVKKNLGEQKKKAPPVQERVRMQRLLWKTRPKKRPGKRTNGTPGFVVLPERKSTKEGKKKPTLVRGKEKKACEPSYSRKKSQKGGLQWPSDGERP